NYLTYAYRSTDGRHDDDVSRVSAIKRNGNFKITYMYNGLGQVVETEYLDPAVVLKQTGTSGSYPDLDRFNRVTTSRWTREVGGGVDFYDIDINYDRNSNITLIEDNVHTGFDVEYTMDDVDRLVEAEEGTWSGSAITSQTRDQNWTLDQVGNWDHATLDLDGDGTFTDPDEYADDRTHNDVNELTGRDIDDSGSDDYTLSYDEVGNLT
ncbi:MAG: hypothetical protein KDA16_14375, partial [Phycisphaerales bacterium]|nr:hypothetical protein [Phycisphaerales bacterium]